LTNAFIARASNDRFEREMLLRRFQFVRGFVTVVTAFWASAALWPPAPAQTARKPETPYEIRACFLVNFALYTEWPKEAFADPQAPFVFGILGRDDFGKDIDIVKDNVLRGRKLVVKHCASVKDVEGCHLLYISASEEGRLTEILQRLGNSSVLTVGEMDGFLEHGGMLNFIVKKTTRPGYGTLGYEVNPAAAEKARLRINSQLLAKSGRD
jgi:hypothetical protein